MVVFENRTPKQFDGFITKVACGWEVAAAGVVVARCVEREEDARALLGEHGASLACWKVGEGGEAERIG